MPREYSVGYKKPPVEYRFKTGNSPRIARRAGKIKSLISSVISIAP